MLGQPDMKRYLGGADVGFGDPASGVWVGGNLTPDKETGIGRKLSQIMPWPALSHLTPDDASAIAAFLQSLAPVKNAVPGAFKASERRGVACVCVVLPAAQYVAPPRPK